MGDEYKYSNKTESNTRQDNSGRSLSTPEPLTPAEEQRIRETKDIIKECFPELLPEIKVFIELGMISGLRDVRAYRLTPPPVTKIVTHVVRDTIHPISGLTGFDVLSITATTPEQLTEAIKFAELKDWQACPINEDTTHEQHLSITMYKPTNKEG